MKHNRTFFFNCAWFNT